VCEVPPPDALPDERDLGQVLDRHLLLDRLDDPDDGRAGEIGERGPAVAKDPGVAVLVRSDAAREPQVGEDALETPPRAAARYSS
jgi:hypothetical protein